MVLGIYCAGSLGKEVYDIAYRVNAISNRWMKIVFIDDVFEGDSFYGAPVYRPSTYFNSLDQIEVVIANGTPVSRRLIRKNCESAGFSLCNIIDPTAIISPSAVLGKGVIVTPYSTISSDAVIDDNVLIQSYVRIGHDINVGQDSVVSANVGIGGKTIVGSQTYIGMGAVVKDELNIGNNVIVSMGAVVHTDIEDNVTVVGSPARVSKRNIDGVVFK